MAKKVFLAGKDSFIGSELYKILSDRTDIELVALDTDGNSVEQEKNINSADITILCLSERASKRLITSVLNPNARIIDTSNAFRTSPGWTYGFPEMSKKQREAIRTSKLVSIPSEFALGVVSVALPLISAKIMAPYHPFYANAIVGYSFGGNEMLKLKDEIGDSEEFKSPRQFTMFENLVFQKECMINAGLSYKPIITPVIANCYSGMLVSIPLHMRTLMKRVDANKVWEILNDYYKDCTFVKVRKFGGEDLSDPFVSAHSLSGTNKLEIFVFGDYDLCEVCIRYDNLGKGSIGSIIQCLNIMLDKPEDFALE